jgi:TPR repeat protein
MNCERRLNRVDADAQYNLGFQYASGRVVPQDIAEASRWYRLAAEQGHTGAQSNLGIAYYAGFGVPQDAVESVRWFRLAAERDCPSKDHYSG